MGLNHASTWPILWDRLAEERQRIGALQQKDPNPWRSGKLLGLSDSSSVFSDLDLSARQSLIGYEEAWRGFTLEIIELYRWALRESEAAYGAGLELALSCQRGFHPTLDAPSLEALLP